MKNFILTVVLIACPIHAMEQQAPRTGLSALLDVTQTEAPATFDSRENLHAPHSQDQHMAKKHVRILYDIQHADVTTIKLSALKETARFEIFDALCSAIAYGEKSPASARIVRRGMMIFGAEGYHAAFIRSVAEKDIALLKGLCSDSYSHMVRIAWQQDSEDYRDAFTTLESNRTWILKNNLQSTVAQLFDSETLRAQAKTLNHEARFSLWRKQLPAQPVVSQPRDEEYREQIIDAQPQIPHSFSFLEEESEPLNELPQKKSPLLMWLDQQIERIGKNWRIVSACCAAGAWFSWHYSARK